MRNRFVGLHLDFVGFSASLLCALHCAALPFLFSLAPLAGLQFLNNTFFEYTIILICFFIASYALVHGYHKYHQNLIALFIVAAGFILIGAGLLLQDEWLEVTLTSFGAAAVSCAHLINWKQIKQSKVEFPECW